MSDFDALDREARALNNVLNPRDNSHDDQESRARYVADRLREDVFKFGAAQTMAIAGEMNGLSAATGSLTRVEINGIDIDERGKPRNLDISIQTPVTRDGLQVVDQAGQPLVRHTEVGIVDNGGRECRQAAVVVAPECPPPRVELPPPVVIVPPPIERIPVPIEVGPSFGLRIDIGGGHHDHDDRWRQPPPYYGRGDDRGNRGSGPPIILNNKVDVHVDANSSANAGNNRKGHR